MREKGYKLFEEDEKKPRFHSSEHGYLLKNYKELSIEYCRENIIDNNMSFMDKLNLIVKKVTDLRGEDFDDIKEELIRIAAYYTSILLEFDETTMVEYRGYDYYALVSGEWGAANTLIDIFYLWDDGKEKSFIENSCRVALSMEECEALGIK